MGCQKKDWAQHKNECTKKTAVLDYKELSQADLDALIVIIKTQFVNIPKIISFVSPERAHEF